MMIGPVDDGAIHDRDRFEQAIAEHDATIADIELAIIDESTTVRSFAQELRTNQVFHRLAQGF